MPAVIGAVYLPCAHARTRRGVGVDVARAHDAPPACAPVNDRRQLELVVELAVDIELAAFALQHPVDLWRAPEARVSRPSTRDESNAAERVGGRCACGDGAPWHDP